MGDSFFKYIQLLELFAFFSGYPLIYALIAFIKGNAKRKDDVRNTLFILLPIAYAIVGLLYLGLQLKKFYPDYLLTHIRAGIEHPLLTMWALLSTLFFIPLLNRKPVISLLHSLVFFFFILKDFYMQTTSPVPDPDVLKNYTRVYSDSIILNIGVLLFLLVAYYAGRSIIKRIHV